MVGFHKIIQVKKLPYLRFKYIFLRKNIEMNNIAKTTFTFLSIGFLNLLSCPLMASGYIPMSEQKVNFKSHNKCMVEINKVYSGILQTKNQYNPSTPGITSRINLESSTNGVKIIDKNHAELDAQIWYHHSRANPSIGKVETSHTYTKYNYKCDGKTMIINGSQGYTLSTFEDIPTANEVSQEPNQASKP